MDYTDLYISDSLNTYNVYWGKKKINELLADNSAAIASIHAI